MKRKAEMQNCTAHRYRQLWVHFRNGTYCSYGIAACATRHFQHLQRVALRSHAVRDGVRSPHCSSIQIRTESGVPVCVGFLAMWICSPSSDIGANAVILFVFCDCFAFLFHEFRFFHGTHVAQPFSSCKGILP